MNKNRAFCFRRLFFLCIVFSFLGLGADRDMSFIESFIKAYDVSGKFNHEYHPALLKKTRESFLELEEVIKRKGFNSCGRMVIMGYQEDAIPSYYLDCAKAYINDEAILKTAKGISSPDRNVFGYLTGFILKDAQWMQERFQREPYIFHREKEDIDLFDDQALILQKHAFGTAFDAVFQTRDKLEQDLITKGTRETLQHLVGFWEHLYTKSLNDNFYNSVATQDILFSIDYGKALITGQSPVKKIFVGPDITYPIEVSQVQKEEVTRHAQQFIHSFKDEIVSIDGKKTAYVFCSFVDGVGKSTLLNNLQNFFRYGKDYDKYDRCDNSSSQEATLYEVDESVVIVDLPGQVSHFTSKPQGLVYVEVGSAQMSRLDQIKVIQYVKKNKEEFESAVEEDTFELDSPEAQFVANCKLFDTGHQWLPFVFNDQHYLFNKDKPQMLRILVPLENAHSSGLKTVDPEMMIFSDGLSLPMSLELFYSDLCQKMEEAGIEQVVYVDFMSMYPRTSRETVRLNFVMQQCRRIFGDRYPITNNLYRAFVHQDQEIYHLLKSARKDISEGLALEAVMRWAIHELLISAEDNELHLLEPDELQVRLNKMCDELLRHNYEEIKVMIDKKLQDELIFRHDKNTLDRVYHTVINHSFEDVARYSDLISQVFCTGIQHEYFNELWQGFNMPLTQDILDNPKDSGLLQLGDSLVKVVASLEGECKNITTLEPQLNRLRSQWYAILENLLYCERFPDGSYRPKKVGMYVPSLCVKKGPGNKYYFLQKELSQIKDKAQRPQAPIKYHVIDMQQAKPWGWFANKPHCLDWQNPATFFGIFTFGFGPMEKIKSSVTLIYDQFADECQKKGLSNFIMPTAELVLRANKNKLWGLIDKEVALMYQGQMTNLKSNDPRIPLIRLWVRMVATLEMIAKDPQSMIIVRRGNKEDFASCLKLLERLTLPIYYGIQLDEQLFPDYTTVDPVIAWDLLK